MSWRCSNCDRVCSPFWPYCLWCGVQKQAAKPRYARCFLARPFLGRASTWLSRLRALAEHGPDSLLPRTPASTQLPTCSLYAALDAAVVLAVIETGPDVDAFTSGVALALSAGFLILVALGGLAIVRRILGS